MTGRVTGPRSSRSDPMPPPTPRNSGLPTIGVGAQVHCPDCLVDLDNGGLNPGCPTCGDLYAAFTRLREHIYTAGSGDIFQLARASGVDARTIVKMLRMGFLRSIEPRTGGGSSCSRPAVCEVCKQPSEGSGLCGGCRSRFTDAWADWQRRNEPAASEPERVPVPVRPTPALGEVPVDEEFAALLEEEGVALPPELRIIHRRGMHTLRA